MNSRQRIIFRADGNSRIGLGHVTRSLALAHMLGEEFECVFAIQAPDAALKDQILKSCEGIIELPSCSVSEERFVHELHAYVSEEEIVVLDGYSFGTEYQEQIKSKGAALVCIDDIHSYHFVADAVINQAGGVNPSRYSTAPYTKLYLGPDYALLRQPFLEAARQKRVHQKDRLNIMLCMGGADPANHTLRVAKEIQHTKPEAFLHIVVGSAYKHLISLNGWLAENKQHQLHNNLDAEGICALMRNCQVAVTSASGVAYEYAAVGGSLFVLKTADNQEGMYQFLLQRNIALPYASFKNLINSKEFTLISAELQESQQKVFDGKSDVRLKNLFSRLGLQTTLKIRKVTDKDMMLLFEWANDPEVRNRSFNTAPIPLDIHENWFRSKLDNTGSILYIAEIHGVPAAHIRYEVSADIATISYLISKEFRGKGLGHTVLSKGLKQLLKDRKEVETIEGLVQLDNLASVRAFEKAGFKQTVPDPNYPDAIKFSLHVQEH